MLNRGWRKHWFGSLAPAGVAVLASLLLAAPQIAEAKDRRPDLIPGKATQTGKQYAFHVRRQDFKVKYVVKNLGKRGARNVVSNINFVSNGEGIEGDIDTIRGTIKPGKSAKGTLVQESTSEPLPAGAYKLELCVDFPDLENESAEGNNCETIKGARFYSTYREWVGPFSGKSPFPGGAGQVWGSITRASYTFARYQGRGVFRWQLEDGSLNHRTRGGTSCTYNGQGTFPLSAGNIVINHKAGTYSGGASIGAAATYTIVVRCGGFSFNQPAVPGIPPALVMQNEIFYDGSDELDDSGGDANTNWLWRLEGR